MPVSLSQLASNTAHCEVRAGEHTIHVTYYPARITEKLLVQMQRFESLTGTTVAEGLQEINKSLCRVVKAWDIYEDEAMTMMFPLDPERIEELPLVVRMSVLATVMKDLRPEAWAPQMS